MNATLELFQGTEESVDGHEGRGRGRNRIEQNVLVWAYWNNDCASARSAT